MTDDSTELVKYDRQLLEHHETQPITEVDGVMIFVNNHGKFTAEIAGVKVYEDTLEAAKDKVHKVHVREQQKVKARIGKPCMIYLPGGGWRGDYNATLVQAFFRGVHAGNGTIQYRLPDGTTDSHDGAIIFPEGNEATHRLVAAIAERLEHQKAIDRLTETINGIIEPQQEKMYAGVRTSGYGRQKPQVRNDPDLALEYTRSILMNIWGEDPFGESDQ